VNALGDNAIRRLQEASRKLTMAQNEIKCLIYAASVPGLHDMAIYEYVDMHRKELEKAVEPI
jgi:hypothetical protein